MENNQHILAAKCNCYKGFDAKETFEGMVNSGIRFVELSASPGNSTGISRFESFSKLCEARNQLQQLNLTPLALGGHTDILDEELTDDFVNNIRLAHFFGCRYFVTSVGGSKDPKDIVSTDVIARRIQRFIPALIENDITMVIELHNQYSNGGILKEICQKANSDRVKINYDTANAIFYSDFSDDELLKDIENCVDYIGYIHLKDKAGANQEWNFPALGKGHVPIRQIVELLQKHNNHCPLVIEIEYTSQGIKDIDEANEAMAYSVKTLNVILEK